MNPTKVVAEFRRQADMNQMAHFNWLVEQTALEMGVTENDVLVCLKVHLMEREE
jgi:hypothetical protein